MFAADNLECSQMLGLTTYDANDSDGHEDGEDDDEDGDEDDDYLKLRGRQFLGPRSRRRSLTY